MVSIKGGENRMQNSNLKTQNDNSKLKADLKVRSYRFALSIIDYLDQLSKETICFTIGKQLLRSATSIGANIIEAKASSSKRDFINFFNHALKSANETKFWLSLLRDSKKAQYSSSQSLLQEAIEIANMLGASILTLKGKN
jgi:four helix bundle protein